jgi:hypothetical protein
MIQIVNHKPAKQPQKKAVNESDLRDSLDEEDWKKVESSIVPQAEQQNSDE